MPTLGRSEHQKGRVSRALVYRAHGAFTAPGTCLADDLATGHPDLIQAQIWSGANIQ